jgi:hypothetical protein
MYWAVQTANNIAIAVNQAGYNANWLKDEFKWSEEEKYKMTQPNTLARQQALANACTHGAGSMRVAEEDT